MFARLAFRMILTINAVAIIMKLRPGSYKAGRLMLSAAFRSNRFFLFLRMIFDRDYYCRTANLDRSHRLPLIHFLGIGTAEGLSPHPLVSLPYYLDRYREVPRVGAPPILHFLECGAAAQHVPHPLFSIDYYVSNNPKAAASGSPVFLHYLESGALERFDPHPLFDTKFYLSQLENPASVKCPLAHYLEEGASAGLDPSPYFSTTFYYSQISKLGLDEQNPLIHFVQFGFTEGRQCHPTVPLPIRVRSLLSKAIAPTGAPTPPVSEQLRPSPVTMTADVHSCYEYLEHNGGLLYEEEAECITLDAPEILGGSTPTGFPATLTAPRPYVGELHNVSILGGTRYVFTSDGFVLHDEQAISRSNEYGVKSPHVTRLDDHLFEYKMERARSGLVRQGILISCEHQSNYFHWVVECLPKVLIADQTLSDRSVPLLIPSGLHENLIELLELINVHNRPVLEVQPGQLYQVDKLYVPSDLSRILDRYQGQPNYAKDIVLSQRWVREAAQMVRSRYGVSSAHRKRRLYLRRGHERYRRLLNQDEVEYHLLARGFELVEVSGMDVRTQVRLFSEASEVIAPTGAAVTNMLWTPSQTRTAVLVSDHPCLNLNIWPQLAAASSTSVAQISCSRALNVTGLYAVHDDFSVKLDVLRDYLDRKAGDQEPRAVKDAA